MALPKWVTSKLTQGFGPTEEELDSGYTDAQGRYWPHFNKGYDFATPAGTPIDANVAGTVEFVGDAGDGWGTSVRVRDAEGNLHAYNHLGGASVEEGEEIATGTILGQSGNTGKGTGPHLSYDVLGSSGLFVNPSNWLDGFGNARPNQGQQPLSAGDLGAKPNNPWAIKLLQGLTKNAQSDAGPKDKQRQMRILMSDMIRLAQGGSKNTVDTPSGQAMAASGIRNATGWAGNPWASLASRTANEVFTQRLGKETANWLTPMFVAQIGQESSYDEDVIHGRRNSVAGAKGIAQIMPEYHPGVDPLDPPAALSYAANLLASSYLSYGGDIAKALAAYNAGPGGVQRAVEQGGREWRKYLPAETRKYLDTILGVQ